MQAEVIAIGDEMTSGQRLDTNTQWLSQRLEEFGIRVLYHTTVGDDLEANIAVFRTAFARADVIVCTGGLGPTADDLTRHALADAVERPLVQYQEALEHIQQLFAQRKRPMPERNVVQALFPEGSRMIANPHGSAPGIDLEVERDTGGRSRLFALPGVPAEMREMWEGTVAPTLLQLQGRPRVIAHRCIKCFGIGESDLEQRLPDLIRRGRQPRVGITVSKATITLRVTAEASSETECFDLMGPTIQTIHDCLGDLVFGEGDHEELQHAVIRKLARQKRTLATVEWGPGGTLADWLNEACHRLRPELTAGDDAIQTMPYRGGWVLPADAPADLSKTARQLREALATDVVLAVGHFPTDDHASARRLSVPLLVLDSSGERKGNAPFGGHPDILKARATKHALDFLRRDLLEPTPRNE